MEILNIHQAKTQLSKLLERARTGEEVMIAKTGTPIGRLVRYEPTRPKIASPSPIQGEGWSADDSTHRLTNCLKRLPKAAREVTARHPLAALVAAP